MQLHAKRMQQTAMLREAMMPALQVREMPENVYQELKLQADQDHRSLAQETVFILEDYLHGHDRSERMVDLPYKTPAGRKERHHEALQQLQALRPVKLPAQLSDVNVVIHEARAERDQEMAL